MFCILNVCHNDAQPSLRQVFSLFFPFFLKVLEESGGVTSQDDAVYSILEYNRGQEGEMMTGESVVAEYIT